MRVLVIALAVIGLACGRGAGPNQTLDRYGLALKNRDFGAAYDLM
jgi:hypothetical protein